MRALKYEGTPVEIALGLKQDGNEAARLKRWKEAKQLFTQALGVLRKSHQAPTSTEPVERSESAQEKSQEEKSIEEACYVNRALCNLELSMVDPYLRLYNLYNYSNLAQKTIAPQPLIVPPPSASTHPTSKHSTDPHSPSSP